MKWYSFRDTPFCGGIRAVIACVLVLSCRSDGAELPRHDRPNERISIATKYRSRLFGFSSHGAHAEVDGDLWVIVDAKRPASADSAPDPQDVLVQWRWSGDKLDQKSEILFPKETYPECVLAGERYISQNSPPIIPDAPRVCEITLKDRKGTALSRWSSTGAHWRVFPSANGKYAAVLSVSESDLTRDASKLKDLKCRIGLIDVGAGNVTWVMESQPESLDEQFEFQGYADLALALPTNDGKRIAIMPFVHDGKREVVAVADVAAHKLLWAQPSSKKVKDEYALRFSIDNSVLFVGTRGPHVVSLDAQTGKILGSWAATPDGEHKSGYGLPCVTCLAVSPDGEYMAAVIDGVVGGDVYVRSLRNKKTVRLIHGSKGVVNAVAFSPDSKHLASMDPDSICIWSRQVWE